MLLIFYGVSVNKKKIDILGWSCFQFLAGTRERFHNWTIPSKLFQILLWPCHNSLISGQRRRDREPANRWQQHQQHQHQQVAWFPAFLILYLSARFVGWLVSFLFIWLVGWKQHRTSRCSCFSNWKSHKSLLCSSGECRYRKDCPGRQRCVRNRWKPVWCLGEAQIRGREVVSKRMIFGFIFWHTSLLFGNCFVPVPCKMILLNDHQGRRLQSVAGQIAQCALCSLLLLHLLLLLLLHRCTSPTFPHIW